MAFPQGINFRATSGYVTDTGNDTYEIGDTANYPRTTPQGNSVGWEQAIGTGNTRDRNSGNDPRLAGLAFTVSTQCDYRIDLNAAGARDIRIAGGDDVGGWQILIDLYDTTTSLGSLCNGTMSAAARWFDATNVERTHAAWVSSNAAVAKTFATTICRFRMLSGSAVNTIAHVFVGAASATPKGFPFSQAPLQGLIQR